jgi:16S rRNA (guanine(966)-N(2))-methyltransferase RsmD
MKKIKSSVSKQPRPASIKKATLPGEIRIIGGLWKRSKLPVPTQPGLRPTPDRVRETLFNWLGSDVQGALCLDAFAGTGALGFEAASRGAGEVRLVEHDSALVAQLQRMQTQLKASMVEVVRGDGLAALKSAHAESLDLIFLDPPLKRPGSNPP